MPPSLPCACGECPVCLRRDYMIKRRAATKARRAAAGFIGMEPRRTPLEIMDDAFSEILLLESQLKSLKYFIRRTTLRIESKEKMLEIRAKKGKAC